MRTMSYVIYIDVVKPDFWRSGAPKNSKFETCKCAQIACKPFVLLCPRGVHGANSAKSPKNTPKTRKMRDRVFRRFASIFHITKDLGINRVFAKKPVCPENC
jgi:hypothetical protein